MAIIASADLPQSVVDRVDATLLETMVGGANARAARVAPCLTSPSATWAAQTEYAEGDKVLIAEGEVLEVTTAGTSGATQPTTPGELGDTVTDGTVEWTRVPPTVEQLADARLVLTGALTRWADAGAGAVTQQQAGAFMVQTDTRRSAGYNLWPSEITGLQDICAGDTEEKAFSVDTAPSLSGIHAPWCSINFGATYCSCGADLTGSYPLYG